MLSPESSSWSAYAKFDGWLFKRQSSLWGGYVDGILGAANWKVEGDTEVGSPEQLKSALVLSLSAGVSVGLTRRSRGNSLRLLGHLGVTSRSILGDAYTEKDFLRDAVGSPQRHYLGFEAAVFAQVNEVSFGVRFPLLMGDVPGLTNGQFLPSISLGGSFDLGGDEESALQVREREVAELKAAQEARVIATKEANLALLAQQLKQKKDQVAREQKLRAELEEVERQQAELRKGAPPPDEATVEASPP